MRKHYIDNLRSMVILSLFVFHTFRMYTTADPFYVQGTPNFFCEIIVKFCEIWFMNLLFVLAGMSATYSIQKRNIKEYVSERFMKLLIPFIFGVVLTVPIQTYYAERFHNGYNGGIIKAYGMFFTKVTDLSGYDGGLTPAHLWFLLFLFIISILSLPIISHVKKNGIKPCEKAPSMIKIIALFIFVYIFSAIRIGEALGQYMTYFIIGFMILSKKENLELIEKNKYILVFFAVVLCVSSLTLNYFISWGSQFSPTALTLSALRHLASWVTILGLIGIGQKDLNFSNKWTRYMAKSSFPIYLVHQTILVAIGYYVLATVENVILQIVLIIVLGFISSVAVCELLKKSSITRFMFGVKK